jgi:ubiquitin carboxyl-terminal hydrolase 1
MSRDQRLYDLFDGDPDLQLEYHQDHREEATWDHLTHPVVVLPFLIFTLALIYHIFFILDFNLLPLPELLWNCLVYATPSRLLDVLENYTNPLRTSNPALGTIPRTHAAR